MISPCQTIDIYPASYRFNYHDKKHLNTFIQDLMSDNMDAVQNSQLKWSCHYPDFRSQLSSIFDGIKQKILKLSKTNRCQQNTFSQNSGKHMPSYLSSNIDTKKSKFIVKQIHNLILKTRQLMTNNPRSTQNYQLSKDHFITFLTKVQSIVQLVEQEQNFIKSLESNQKLVPKVNEKLADKILEKELQKVEQQSKSLKQIYNQLYRNNLDPQTQKINQKFKKQITLLQDQILPSYKHNQLLQKKVTQLQHKLNKRNDQFEYLLNQLNLQNHPKQKIQFFASDLRTTMTKQQQKINELQKQITCNLKPKIQEMTQQLEYAKFKRSQAQKYSQQLLQNPTREYRQYFKGRIFNDQSYDNLKWFVTSLEENVKKRIRSTQLLYRLDMKNKQSIHSYIDNIPNIVLLVKLQNKQIIAGYSKPAFIPKATIPEHQQGYMFGVMNRKVFRVKKKTRTFRYMQGQYAKPIIYDEAYIIWGYSDIRIRSNSTEFYSNYAKTFSFYEEPHNEDSSPEDLLQDSDRQISLTDYELFAIKFQEDKQ